LPVSTCSVQSPSRRVRFTACDGVIPGSRIAADSGVVPTAEAAAKATKNRFTIVSIARRRWHQRWIDLHLVAASFRATHQNRLFAHGLNRTYKFGATAKSNPADWLAPQTIAPKARLRTKDCAALRAGSTKRLQSRGHIERFSRAQSAERRIDNGNGRRRFGSIRVAWCGMNGRRQQQYHHPRITRSTSPKHHAPASQSSRQKCGDAPSWDVMQKVNSKRAPVAGRGRDMEHL
jgi:hypothetical protein